MKNLIELRHFLILIVCSILFYSCTSSQISVSNDISFEDIRSRVNENATRLKSLDAEGEISIDSPNLSNTGSITVSIFKPDSIYTKLEGPFGVDVADLLITRNNFIYYNVMENKVIRGSSTAGNLSLIMKIKLEFDDIINAFSGKFMFDTVNFTNVKVINDDNNYVVTLESENEIKKYWINSSDFYVTGLRTSDLNGNIKVEIAYENFFENNGIYFPTKISIKRPKENQNIWLTYSKEEFNNNKLTYKLRIPKSARKIQWK